MDQNPTVHPGAHEGAVSTLTMLLVHRHCSVALVKVTLNFVHVYSCSAHQL